MNVRSGCSLDTFGLQVRIALAILAQTFDFGRADFFLPPPIRPYRLRWLTLRNELNYNVGNFVKFVTNCGGPRDDSSSGGVGRAPG
jgi:hypothetical protein